MATRKAPVVQLRPANLSPAQMQQALPKLKKRLDELKSFNPQGTLDDVSDAAKSLHHKFEDTLSEIFQNETHEYHRYHISSFYQGIPIISIYGPEPSLEEKKQPYIKGISNGAKTIQTILDLFNEKLEEAGAPVGTNIRTLESLDLHPMIADAVVDLYRGGHYANAVEDACKALDGLVKLKSKKDNVSGTELMQLVFSPKNPILKFNEQANESEKSEQQGMQFLYAGAMLAFRNPRAHGLLSDDPVLALEIIGFVNFLAKSLATTKRV